MATRTVPDPSRYRIGWIAPLHLERTAAVAAIDERFDDIRIDGHIYTGGKIGEHYVVIAVQPRMGTDAASALAERMRLAFRNIDFFLVVGIGGGVPEYGPSGSKSIMVLGDVVVSVPTAGYGGVVRYDFGAWNGEHHDQLTMQGHTDKPPDALLSAVNTLRSNHSDNTKSAIPQMLEVMRLRIADQERAKFLDQGGQNDRLNEDNYAHADQTRSQSCEECCNEAMSRTREQRGNGAHRETDHPQVHYGNIGSSNQLQISAFTRNRKMNENSIICFEMEGAGVMDRHPCLVIRGICDYSDSHKNKRWQQYAALTAAAYAKELLGVLPSAKESHSSSVNGEVIPQRGSINRHWTVPRMSNPLFTGREGILARIRDAFETEKTACEGQRRFVITGLGGQGKSEICVKVADQLREKFWAVLWVDVSVPSTALEDYKAIAQQLGSTADTLKEAVQLLANQKQRWLLILDNADDPEVDYQVYFPSGAYGSIIMTSRIPASQLYNTVGFEALDGLDAVNATTLVLSAAQIAQDRKPEDLESAKELVERLGTHTLALIQAGSYIANGHCRLDQYIEVFEKRRVQLFKYRPRQAESRYVNIYATFEASATVLEESTSEDAKDALDLLAVHSMFHCSTVPFELYYRASDRGFRLLEVHAPACTRSQHRIRRRLWGRLLMHVRRLLMHVRKRSHDTAETSNRDTEIHQPWRIGQWHALQLPAFMVIKNFQENNSRLMNAVELLESLSLISRESDRGIYMHPLLHEWAKFRQDPAQQASTWIRAGCVISLYILEHWNFHAAWLRVHLLFFLETDIGAALSFGPSDRIVPILVTIGYRFLNDQDIFSLKSLLMATFSTPGIDSSNPPRESLRLHNLQAKHLREIGSVKAAVQLQERLLELTAEMYSRDSVQFQDARYGLALTYLEDGRAARAIELLQEVVTISADLIPDTSEKFLTRQNALANALLRDGQVTQAIEHLERVVAVQCKTMDETHYLRLISQHQLAVAYLGIGKFAPAIEMLERLVTIECRILAETHSSRLASQYMLARAYCEANQHLDKAVKMIEHVVRVENTMLPEKRESRTESEELLEWAYELRGTYHRELESFDEIIKSIPRLFI